MTLGLLAIMLDESAYVDRWAETIARAAQLPGAAFDRVLVIDGGSADNTIERLSALHVPTIVRPFTGHFADQRNFGVDQLDCDWIFELDADEIPSTPLLAGLRDFVAAAERNYMDCVGIPRLNFIDGTLVAGPGHKGLDYQYRLHQKSCHWRGAVHEEITGYRARHEITINDGHFIQHAKDSARNAARNAYYRTISP